MEIRTLADWPFAVRCLITFGQRLANEKVHAETGGAHVLHALMTMTPVRKAFDEGTLAEIDKACAKALLVARRGGATTAILTQPLAIMLVGTPQKPPPGPFTTASFLASFLVGSMFLEKALAAMKEKADTLAKLLDAPRIEELLTKSSTPEMKALSGALFVGVAAASEMQHQLITTRHVMYGALMIVDRTLAKAEKEALPEPLQRMKDLLERTVPKRDAKVSTMVVHSRLYGAVAGVLATTDKDDEIEAKLVGACLEGDPEIAFVREAILLGKERMGAPSS